MCKNTINNSLNANAAQNPQFMLLLKCVQTSPDFSYDNHYLALSETDRKWGCLLSQQELRQMCLEARLKDGRSMC